MRINKFLFPPILLVIFIDVIALGMALGYWKTTSGGRRGPHSSDPTPAAVSVEIRAPSSFEGERAL